MFIAKVLTRKGQEVFAEIIGQGSPMFDPRPGWVLLKTNLHLPERKREVVWVHPDDELFVWVRQFNF